MKKIHRIGFLIIAAAFVLINTTCTIDSPLTAAIADKINEDLDTPGDGDNGEDGTEEDTTVTVTGVSLDKDSITMPVGAAEQLTAAVEPADATDQSVTWSSDNDSVVTVDAEGLVTGASEGTAAVTVTTTDGGFTDTCDVTVSNTAKEITAFSFTAADNTALSSDVTGTINGTDISATVPYGTDVTALVATFSTTGASVTVGGTTQISGTTANDFSSPVTYTVTAEDASTRNYTVTVAIKAAAEGPGFAGASTPGDTGTLTLGESGETLTMVYAQDQPSISFPTGTNDGTPSTLTTKFFTAETEVTNAVVAAVLQWAYDEGWFSSSGHNELSTSTVKYGNHELLDLDDSDCRVDYDGSGTFSAQSGYENNPVTDISWYGAIMVCNWLTVMRDGNTNNVVYTGIDTDWQDDETIEDNAKNGYRLPTSDEWEYTARYLGTTAPSTGDDLDTERLYGNADASWTDSYYWTPGDYASGATADYNDGPACQAVAVYDYTDPDPYNDEQEVKSRGSGSENTLGLYDMSGNVREWCFTSDGSDRILRGGSWSHYASTLRVGGWYDAYPYYTNPLLGFRVCRTAD